MSFKNSGSWRLTNAKRQVIPLPWRSNAERLISIDFGLASGALSSSCPLERKDVKTESAYDGSGD